MFRRRPERVEHLVEKDGTLVLRFGPNQATARAKPTKDGYSVSIAPPDSRTADAHAGLFTFGSVVNDILSHGAHDPKFADVFCASPHPNALIALADQGFGSVGEMVQRVAALKLTDRLIAEYVAAKHPNESTHTGIAAALIKQPGGVRLLDQLYGADAKRVLQSVDLVNAGSINNLPEAVLVAHGSDAAVPPPYVRPTTTPSNTVVSVQVPTAAAMLLPRILGGRWELHGPLGIHGGKSTYVYTDSPADRLTPYQRVGERIARVQLASRPYAVGAIITDPVEGVAWTVHGAANVARDANGRTYRALVDVGVSELLVELVSFDELTKKKNQRDLPEDKGALRDDIFATLQTAAKRLSTNIPGYTWSVQKKTVGMELLFSSV
jgi:hypothetical protein